MNQALQDKVAFVTGGARGIGAAIVKRLARDGAAVAGHLQEGHVRPTLEVIATESPTHLRRRSSTGGHTRGRAETTSRTALRTVR